MTGAYQPQSFGASFGSHAGSGLQPNELPYANRAGGPTGSNRSIGQWPDDYLAHQRSPTAKTYQGMPGIAPGQFEGEMKMRSADDTYPLDDEPPAWTGSDFYTEGSEGKMSSHEARGKSKGFGQRKPSNRDEFDGPHQLLDKPSPGTIAAQEKELPHLATNLFVDEQDSILSQVNDRLSKCAYDFVAKYQFPIPLESDKRPVKVPSDREWTEWVYLLKRLATKRRIPARVLYNGQIKQLITVLENSLEMRHAAKHQSRPLKDDRNVLQLISAGLQVAKILKDASAMEYLDQIYSQTEQMIHRRKSTPGYLA